tara:strand:- start:16 stop:2058 length:2043 start_codon:yes stop_codon:yes gene_type:complete
MSIFKKSIQLKNLKKIRNKILLLIFVLFGFTTNAEIFDPISWQFSQTKISENKVELRFRASIDEGWHLYSQDIEESPPATTFSFIINGDTSIIKVEEPESIQEYDPNFDMILKYFKDEVVFKYNIDISNLTNNTVGGYIDFMLCDEAQCLPPDYIEFSFEVKEESEQATKETKENKGRLLLFLSALGAGLLAVLMPCTFPMIPMTVSFFTKQSKNRVESIKNAVFYGISIIIIYVIVGVGVASIFGSDSANLMANNIYFNIGFAVLLLIFGASFLGAFELELPSSWTNKSAEKEGKGGYLGIFFMALTLVLVSFSCTGPLVGVVLVKAASGEILDPVIGMFGFALSLSIPFVLFALFPNWLSSLPKSGGWLNSIKVVLGFLEIAFAFYYLSKADLIDGEAFISREMFIAIWIMIFGSLTLYLLGFIKFSHDSDIKHLSVSRFSLALITGVYTIYMIPALWGGPAKLMFGMPPDVNHAESQYGIGNSFYENNVSELMDEIEILRQLIIQSSNGEINEQDFDLQKKLQESRVLGPQRIKVFKNYEDGLKYAKLVNKPIMLDFTGHACVNCRQMESNIWSDSEIKRILKDELVVISLYVDETNKLPKEEQYETKLAGKNKKVRTIGDKWMVFQAEKYGNNSQPYYVFLDTSEKQLIENANYQDYGSVNLFKDWLNRGLEAFEE